MSGAKRWWNDQAHKSELTARAEAGDWHVVADDVPGQVIKIVYAGYKIKIPDGAEVIINPDTLGEKLRDVTIEEYPEFVAVWLAKDAKRIEGVKAAEAAHVAKLVQQSGCLHPSCQTRTVVKAAGCDIDDTCCNACGKILRRSWSTASDRDPDDHVSDWNWWVREYNRLYNQTPNATDYKIVETIGSDF